MEPALYSDEIEQAVLKDGHIELGLTQANQHYDSWKTVTPTADKLAMIIEKLKTVLPPKRKLQHRTKAL